MEKHLRGGFIHGLKKPIKDSLKYLFGNATVGYAQLLIAARKNGGEYFESKTVTVKSATTDSQEMLSHDNFKALIEQVAHLMAGVETKGGNDQKCKGQKKKKSWPPSSGGDSNQSPSSSSGNNTNNSNRNSSSGETQDRPTTNRAYSQWYRCEGFGHFASVPPL